jgi:hypothetical protein
MPLVVEHTQDIAAASADGLMPLDAGHALLGLVECGDATILVDRQYAVGA